MATTFEDNTVVTAEDLNNIAVDLGDATFSAFSNSKFGVDKLNEITADLVDKGVLTTGDKCEPVVSNGKVYIKSGVIVFGSGAKIKITEPVEITAILGGYIYGYNDTLTGKASIVCNTETPTIGDFVMLAQIDNSGNVIDKRTLCEAKALKNADFSIQTFSNVSIVQGDYVDGVLSLVSGEINLGTTALRRMVGFRVPNITSPNKKDINCYYDFTNTKNYTINVPEAINGQKKAVYVFELSGTVLKWKISSADTFSNKKGTEFVMEVDMI